MFALHPQLARDSFPVHDLVLCRALLMNNRHFPWLILVPRLEAASELTDLLTQQRYALMDEIALASRVMQRCYAPEKLNIATLGNQVPQLHIHIIARFKSDPAWPHPVWGRETGSYTDAAPLLGRLQEAFADP